MKKIITTVGTSLITNAIEDENIKLKKSIYDELKNKKYSDINNAGVLNYINPLKTSLDKIYSSGPNISAEIASIIKISEQEKDHIEVYLIATDTILSPICAEYVQKWFTVNKVENIDKVFFEYSPKFIIEKLQVKLKTDFEKDGLTNLFSRIRDIAASYWDNCILNITGGYKSLIPYMTIISQINKIPAYYNFQETKDDKFDLLKIPNVPINIDFSLFERYRNRLLTDIISIDKATDYDFLNELGSLLEPVENNETMLTALGLELWEKYKEKFFLFYCSEEVYLEFSKQKDIQRIFVTKFHSKLERDSKIKPELQHKSVFKDGNNNNRIYYFEHNSCVYVYKTFENHAMHESFLLTPFNENIKKGIIENSKPYKIQITK